MWKKKPGERFPPISRGGKHDTQRKQQQVRQAVLCGLEIIKRKLFVIVCTFLISCHFLWGGTVTGSWPGKKGGHLIKVCGQSLTPFKQKPFECIQLPLLNSSIPTPYNLKSELRTRRVNPSCLNLCAYSQELARSVINIWATLRKKVGAVRRCCIIPRRRRLQDIMGFNTLNFTSNYQLHFKRSVAGDTLKSGWISSGYLIRILLFLIFAPFFLLLGYLHTMSL